MVMCLYQANAVDLVPFNLVEDKDDNEKTDNDKSDDDKTENIKGNDVKTDDKKAFLLNLQSLIPVGQ